MANPEHVDIVKQGKDAIDQWRVDNQRTRLDLESADLRGLMLQELDLRGAVLKETDFSGSNLRNCNLYASEVSGTKFRNANLEQANLELARIQDADFKLANLLRSNLDSVALINTDLTSALLGSANLRSAYIERSNPTRADIHYTVLSYVSFIDVNLTEAKCNRTIWPSMDLSVCHGLQSIIHSGPSSLPIGAIIESRGKLPKEFLEGCGVPKWLQGVAKLADPNLRPVEIADMLTVDVFHHRTEGSLVSGVFLSYSHADSKLVDKLHKAFKEREINVWHDKHDLVAGPVAPQLKSGIELKKRVVLVLSEHSLQSKWVWHETAIAQKLEREAGRHVLCPIAVDDAWCNPEDYDKNVQRAVSEHAMDIDYLKTRNILDFSNSRQFNKQFEKLVKGLKLFYSDVVEDE